MQMSKTRKHASKGVGMYRKLKDALALLFLAGICGTAHAQAPDGDAVMELHRSGLAFDAQGNTAAALPAFTKACDLGLPAACTMAGLIEHEAARTTDHHMRAARLFAKACRAGDDLACMQTGIAIGPLSRASSEAPGSTMVLALLAMAEECRHSNGEQACVDTAQLLGADEEHEADLVAARAYAERGCEKERFAACAGVAMLPGKPRTRAETVQRNVALCTGGWAGGCDALLNPLMAGVAGENTEHHLDVLKGVCEQQLGIACANLGLYFSHGPEDARSFEMARSYMRLGCDEFVAKACFAFGVMHKKGIGGPVNEARAVSLVAHSCELGEPKACFTLVGIAAKADDGEAGGIAASEALRRACRLGDQVSCEAQRL